MGVLVGGGGGVVAGVDNFPSFIHMTMLIDQLYTVGDQ